MERLRPDDHFMILAETDATPMHIGGLVLLDTGDAAADQVFAALYAHLTARLVMTPLVRRLRPSPFGYDSDAWIRPRRPDPGLRIGRVDADTPMDEDALLKFVADSSLRRVSLDGPPFHIDIMLNLADRRSAILIKVHHALMDGVGFQTLMDRLSDADVQQSGAIPVDSFPLAPFALLRSWLRFRRERDFRPAAASRRREAIAALKAWPTPRSRTPTLKLTGPTSDRRDYAVLSLPLAEVKRAAAALQATVNDILLAIVASAVREALVAIDDLPKTPIVASAARSYRRVEHGDYGNRIVALNPHLATHIADPMARLRAIQASMADEMSRSPYEEAVLDQPEQPFGSRDRRARFAARRDGGALLPGNITVSNVPGPAQPRTFAQYRQISNYPVPLLATGRFLNVTSRRNGDHLDLGIMADPTKSPGAADIAAGVRRALTGYAKLAKAIDDASGN